MESASSAYAQRSRGTCRFLEGVPLSTTQEKTSRRSKPRTRRPAIWSVPERAQELGKSVRGFRHNLRTRSRPHRRQRCGRAARAGERENDESTALDIERIQRTRSRVRAGIQAHVRGEMDSHSASWTSRPCRRTRRRWAQMLLRMYCLGAGAGFSAKSSIAAPGSRRHQDASVSCRANTLMAAAHRTGVHACAQVAFDSGNRAIPHSPRCSSRRDRR